MNTTTQTTATKLANEFSRILRDWLTADELAEVNRVNKIEDEGRFCHTHYFCDSSEAMLEAFEKVVGKEYRCNDFNNGLIDGAWNMARANEFKEVE